MILFKFLLLSHIWSFQISKSFMILFKFLSLLWYCSNLIVVFLILSILLCIMYSCIAFMILFKFNNCFVLLYVMYHCILISMVSHSDPTDVSIGWVTKIPKRESGVDKLLGLGLGYPVAFSLSFHFISFFFFFFFFFAVSWHILSFRGTPFAEFVYSGWPSPIHFTHWLCSMLSVVCYGKTIENSILISMVSHSDPTDVSIGWVTKIHLSKWKCNQTRLWAPQAQFVTT